MTADLADRAADRPSTQDDLLRLLRENHAGPKAALTPIGGKTSLDLGFPLSKPARPIALDGLDRVVEFPARDMTVTVEAGIRIARLQALLAAENLRLPIDVRRSDRATLGGALAANISGPRRFGHGAFRDSVIGLTAVTADGREFHSGGRVVKNVAGYDLCKLLVGSLGTLAVISQVTLKLKPIPESAPLVLARFSDRAQVDRVLDALLKSETRPVAVEVLNSAAWAFLKGTGDLSGRESTWMLLVGFEGSRRETEWQCGKLVAELGAFQPQNVETITASAAEQVWISMIDFPPENVPAFQATILPSQSAAFEGAASQQGLAVLSHAASGIVMCSVPAHWTSRRVQDTATLLRDLVGKSGSLTVLQGTAEVWESFPRLTLPQFSGDLMRRVKAAFDPHNLLNPGRLFAPY